MLKENWVISRFGLGKQLEVKVAIGTLRSQVTLNLLFQKTLFKFQTEVKNSKWLLRFLFYYYTLECGQYRYLRAKGRKNSGKSQGAKLRWDIPLAVGSYYITCGPSGFRFDHNSTNRLFCGLGTKGFKT